MNLAKWPFYDEEQIKICESVLTSGNVNYWTGNQTKLFQNEYAIKFDSKFAIALSNGSLALSAAYLSLGIGKNDQIITTPRTFIATASSAVLLGAHPVFADVNRDSGNITADTIEPLINKKTKAIVVVHLGGWPADMIEICKLAKSYDIPVIEDCAQAHGAKILIDGKEKSVGSFGDVSAWSFCQDKIISTAGEGGMITTNSEYFYDKIWSFKDHGKTRESINKKHKSGFRWVHDRFGSNFRMTEIQSAIGRIQLKKLDEWSKLREKNALILKSGLEDLSSLRIPFPSKEKKHAWYKFHCYLNKSALLDGWDRDRILDEINQYGYPAFAGSCSEIYLEKCFKNSEYRYEQRLLNAKELGETSLMFLVHPTITNNQMINYLDVIKSVCKKATK